MDRRSLARGLDRLTDRRRRLGLPAPQVLVETPHDRFGHGDLDQPFHTASISKVVTATLVMQQVEAGRLTPDQRLVEVLPAADTAGFDPRITIEHLLTHTAGLDDLTVPQVPAAVRIRRGLRHLRGRPQDDPWAVDTDVRGLHRRPDRAWSTGELLDRARSLPPLSAPGTRFSYSDSGYLLLTRVVEEASGVAFTEAVRTGIAAPSGIGADLVPLRAARSAADVAAAPMAPVHFGGRGAGSLHRSAALTAGNTDGGVVASPVDLVRFQRALVAGRLVSPDTLTWMARPRHRLRPGLHYGAGLVEMRFGGFLPTLARLPSPVGGIGLSATQLFHYRGLDAHVVLNLHDARQTATGVRLHIAIARLLTA